jgi:hypothetical protein
MPIVMTRVAAQDAFEMRFVHDQEVIEALRSDGAHEPFGKGICIRGPIGRPQDLSAFGSEDFVEAHHVLGVTIADQELGCDARISEITSDIPRLLGDPSRAGMSRDPGDPDSPVPELDKEQHL